MTGSKSAAAAARSVSSGGSVPWRNNLHRRLSIVLAAALLCTLFVSLSVVANDDIQRLHKVDKDLMGRFVHDDDHDHRPHGTSRGQDRYISAQSVRALLPAATKSNATEAEPAVLELLDDSRSCFRARPPSDAAAAPISKPILNLGFPKQGSTSLQHFFKCGGLESSHFNCRKLKPDKGPGWHEDVLCGKCIRFARRKGHMNVLETCGSYDAYTQLDVELEMSKGGCYFPQIIALDLMHDEQPNATFVLTFRPVNKWINSIANWKGFDTPMIDRLGQCGIRGLDDNTPQGLADWWCNHVERIRKYVDEHPSHRLVEIDVEGKGTGAMMARTFGIEEECWSHSNKNVIKGLADHEIQNMTETHLLPKWMRRLIARRKKQAQVG